MPNMSVSVPRFVDRVQYLLKSAVDSQRLAVGCVGSYSPNQTSAEPSLTQNSVVVVSLPTRWGLNPLLTPILDHSWF